jgi:hypothetical protein
MRTIALGQFNLCRTIICPNPDFDFDIFIHTWDKQDKNGGGLDIKNETIEVFRAIKTVIEPEKRWDMSRYNSVPNRIVYPGSDGSHILSMFYKVKQCHDLMLSSGKQYDLVIRTRTDFTWDEPFPLARFLSGGNKVFVPNGGTILPASESDRGKVSNIDVMHSGVFKKNWLTCAVCDCFAVGSQESMGIYAGTYDSIDKLIDKYRFLCPESILYQQLETNDIDIVPIREPSHIFRATGGVVYFGPP